VTAKRIHVSRTDFYDKHGVLESAEVNLHALVEQWHPGLRSYEARDH